MKSLPLLFIINLFFSLIACAKEDQHPSPKVCLNMIVKNESQVITRCLSSVLPFIDYWIIVDTGSTDGTQQIIKDFMHKNGIPGELFERPWVNFGHNRNEALALAKEKGDYIFFIDADEYLTYEPNFVRPKLDRDYYYITMNCCGTKYSKIHLINTHLPWEWIGVLHEVLCPPASASYATLENVANIYTTEGARSRDPQKYQKDAEILEAALKEDPNNCRYVFYLAKSYGDAGDYLQALKNYEKRIEMGGWEEEVFYSLLQIGLIHESLGKPEEVVINCYNRAYQYRKSRVEPLYQIARFYRIKGNFEAGYLAAKIAQTLPVSNDLLFIHRWIYDYGIALELSICAYWTEKYEECQQICLDLLKIKDLPDNVRTCVEKNLEFANSKLIEKLCNTTSLKKTH